MPETVTREWVKACTCKARSRMPGLKLNQEVAADGSSVTVTLSVYPGPICVECGRLWLPRR